MIVIVSFTFSNAILTFVPQKYFLFSIQLSRSTKDKSSFIIVVVVVAAVVVVTTNSMFRFMRSTKTFARLTERRTRSTFARGETKVKFYLKTNKTSRKKVDTKKASLSIQEEHTHTHSLSLTHTHRHTLTWTPLCSLPSFSAA